MRLRVHGYVFSRHLCALAPLRETFFCSSGAPAHAHGDENEWPTTEEPHAKAPRRKEPLSSHAMLIDAAARVQSEPGNAREIP